MAERSEEIDLLRMELSATAKQMRVYLFSLLVVSAYFVIVIGSTNDIDFLRKTNLPIPILNIETSVSGVYVISPLILLFLHLNLLLNLVLLSRKASLFNSLIETIKPDSRKNFEREITAQSIFLQPLVGVQLPIILFIITFSILYLIIFVFPLLVLSGFQVRYLPAHDLSITSWHKLFLVVDIFISLVSGYMIFRQTTRIMFVFAFSSILMTGVLFSILSVFIFIPPSDKFELKIFEPFVRYVFGPDLIDHPSHFKREEFASNKMDDAQRFFDRLFHRNLDLRGQVLVRKPPSEIMLAMYKLNGERQSLAWRETAQRMDLSGRDLRYANLKDAKLYGIDLSGADLSGAVLIGTEMHDSTLVSTRFIGANIQDAILSGSRINSADFTGATIYQSEFINVSGGGGDFSFSKISESDFRGSIMPFTVFAGTKISNSGFFSTFLSRSVFFEARVRGSNFSFSVLSDSRITKSSFEDLRSVNIDARLYNVDLTGVEFGELGDLDPKLIADKYNAFVENSIVGNDRNSQKEFRRRNFDFEVGNTYFRGIPEDADVVVDGATKESAESSDVLLPPHVVLGSRRSRASRREAGRFLAKSTCRLRDIDESVGQAKVVLITIDSQDGNKEIEEFGLAFVDRVEELSSRGKCESLAYFEGIFSNIRRVLD